MWLLNIFSKRLEYFEGRNIPKYAILSHRWEEEEVLHQDIVERTRSSRKGNTKLEQTCTQAGKDGFRYVWTDTCCIDKRSSADLSEAINSMYRWYAQAEVCYAFLLDITYNSSFRTCTPPLQDSMWFTRGWTLQELFAPSKLIFLDKKWTKIGDRASCRHWIRAATKIPEIAIKKFKPEEWSIALKMSWAAKRETTRIEDMTYCLLGLFQINMPLLYGEGPNAFSRLQEELSKISIDRSLFAWQGDRDTDPIYKSYDTAKVDSSTAFFAPHVMCFGKNVEDDGQPPLSDLNSKLRQCYEPPSHIRLGLMSYGCHEVGLP